MPPQLCCVGVAPDPGGVPYRHGRLLTGRSRWHSQPPVPRTVAVCLRALVDPLYRNTGTRRQGSHLMKALVYHGPGRKAWEHVPDPKIINPTDAIVQVDITTICGTDLHILKGDVPAVTDGRILGHEGVGTITEVGQAVGKLAVGDRVIISCITSCGSCSYCHQQLPAHCLDDEGTSGIGWIFGHLIDGTQAEYVRVPFAENSLHKTARGCERRGRGHALRHPAHGLRDRGAQRPGQARRRRRRHRRRTGGPVGDDDRRALRRLSRHRRSTSTTTGSSRPGASAPPTASTAAMRAGRTRCWP